MSMSPWTPRRLGGSSGRKQPSTHGRRQDKSRQDTKTSALTLPHSSIKNATLMILPSGRNRTEQAMESRLARKQTGQLMQSEPLSPKQQIIVALGTLALMRGGEYSQATLTAFSEGLLKEPFEDVIATIQKIAESPRRDRETACPDFGTLLVAIRSIRHPQRHLRGIVAKLARIFGVTVDEELLGLYEERVGHRTDQDMDTAYRVLSQDETLKKMPTPAMFLAACGVPKIYRDGTRPE